ncbi:MAG TPA: type II secretion system protein, partial [Victivallales bacterium]|nr:type II secretion system protein [Victivallales bacterium]
MKTHPKIKLPFAVFSLIEIYIAMVIFLVLASLFIPKLYRSMQWAKYNRWLAYNRALSNDPDCVLNFNFQEGKGDVIYNSALGADVENHQASKYNGYLRNKNGGAHKFQWVKSGGRWGRNGYKHALQFNGADTYVLIPGTQGLDFSPDDDFTILTWVKFDKLALGDCPFSK